MGLKFQLKKRLARPRHVVIMRRALISYAIVVLVLQTITIFPILGEAAELSRNGAIGTYAEALIEGLEQESVQPIIPPKERAVSRILMAVGEKTLFNAPYFGLLNFHQSGTTRGSSGSDSRKRRAFVEESILRNNSGGSLLYPKYAYYDQAGDFQINFMEHYGSILFEPRDHVYRRSTYTLGDSADDFRRPVPLGRRASINHLPGKIAYVEAQMWGGLWLSDIEKIYIPEEVFKANQSRLIQMSKKFGFGITLIRWKEKPRRIEMGRVVRAPSEGVHPKIESVSAIKQHLAHLDNAKHWESVLSSTSLDLPKETQAEIARQFPHVKDELLKAQQAHAELLRHSIMDRNTPVIARVEALRQWTTIGSSIDQALLVPVMELAHDKKAIRYAKKIGFEIADFQGLSKATGRLSGKTSIKELILKGQMGYPLKSDEVTRLKKYYYKTPDQEILAVLSKIEPLFIYDEKILLTLPHDSSLVRILMQSLTENPIDSITLAT